MQEYQIFALKGDADWIDAVVSSLAEGVGRFGWSYVQGCDLHILKARVDQLGWESLNEEEQDCFQAFLLDLKAGDWVVYVNVPEWGKCTMARVAGPYYWEWTDTDFNHRFKVDVSTVREFDRNDIAVQPALRGCLETVTV